MQMRFKAALVAAAAAAAFASPAAAQVVIGGGLVDVSLTNALNDLAITLNVNVTDVPVTVQGPWNRREPVGLGGDGRR